MRRKNSDIRGEQAKVQLWFEYYKLARSRADMAPALKKSKKIYTLWGRVNPETKFSDWWDRNFAMFGEMGVQEDILRKPLAGWLFLIVPLNQKRSSIMRQFRDMVTARQEAFAYAQGISPAEYKRKGFAPRNVFELTPGRELRVRNSTVSLILYKRFVIDGRIPVINAKLLERVQKYLLREMNEIPSPLVPDIHGENLLSALRSLRRYFYKAEELIRAAADGDFPGAAGKLRG